MGKELLIVNSWDPGEPLITQNPGGFCVVIVQDSPEVNAANGSEKESSVNETSFDPIVSNTSKDTGLQGLTFTLDVDLLSKRGEGQVIAVSRNGSNVTDCTPVIASPVPGPVPL